MKNNMLSILLIFFTGIIIVCVPMYVGAQTLTIHDIGAQYDWDKYETFDGKKLDLYVYEPQGDAPEGGRPAVVFIHGGGWVGGKPDFFMPHCQYFAKRGAVAFTIQYRLVNARGMDAFDELERCIYDCRAALVHIRLNAEKYGIDPAKITVLGDSAGGHLAACLAVLEGVGEPETNPGVSTRADAAVCYNPATDMNFPLTMKIFQIKGEARGDETVWPKDAVTQAKRYSPIEYVKRGLPPILIMHGTNDTTIPCQQAKDMTSAMKKAGNRCDLALLEGRKHAFVIVGYGTEETIVRALHDADEFLVSLGFLDGEPLIRMAE